MLRSRLAASFVLLVSFASTLAAAPADDDSPSVDQAYIKANYTKYEYQIPMRDGVKLFTAVYVPKDSSETYPILLQRTPYSVRPYGEANFRAGGGQMGYYAKEKFIFAYQDVRGRNGSEGEFVHIRPHRAEKGPKDFDESTDTYDTIEWLTKNVPLNNGKVGMLGISYPGFYAAAGMIDAHPALKAVSPQAPVTEWFIGDDFRHNGAFYLAHSFRFMSFFAQPLAKPTRQSPQPFDYETPDGYEFYLKIGPLVDIPKKFDKGLIFWNEMLEHSTYDDFWKARNVSKHFKGIRPAVMTVGGWFDAEDLYGTLDVYHANEEKSPGGYNVLVMGPWAHGEWYHPDGDRLGNVRFDSRTAAYYRKNIELPFFKHFLKGADDPKLPEAFVFETGTNQWRKYDQWPPKNVEAKTLYFHAGGKLSFDPPKEGPATKDTDNFDEYISDPNKPVPFIPNIAIGMTDEHMTDDQRFASSRTDVLTYVTEPLTADITIAGPISPKLFVSTTGTDSDFVVKLIDVYSGDFPNPEPNPAGVQMGGYQQLVRGEAMRGKFRNGYEKPEPFEPGRVTKVEYVMPDAYHTFRRGHRIMVHVQSSWFPLVDRNPQKFMEIAHAKAEDFQKATQRVYRSPAESSQVKIQVLPQGAPGSPTR
jgi:uncharacterized protein